MNLYDQLLQLQVIEHAFSEWQTYRSQITKFIIEHTKPGQSLAICGAGRCNDLDLVLLKEHFQHITLLDKDENSMLEAKKQYGLETESYVDTLKIDFVGISDTTYRQYADTLIAEAKKYGKATNVHHLAEVVLKLLLQLEPQLANLSSPLETGQYDVVVAVGVHSQLLNMLEWIWGIILETLELDEPLVRKKIGEMNTLAVEKLNDLLFAMTKSCLIIGIEQKRVDRVGSIQGAMQCMQDIQHYQEAGVLELVQDIVLEWPFDLSAQKVYEMGIQILKKV